MYTQKSDEEKRENTCSLLYSSGINFNFLWSFIVVVVCLLFFFLYNSCVLPVYLSIICFKTTFCSNALWAYMMAPEEIEKEKRIHTQQNQIFVHSIVSFASQFSQSSSACERDDENILFLFHQPFIFVDNLGENLWPPFFESQKECVCIVYACSTEAFLLLLLFVSIPNGGLLRITRPISLTFSLILTSK